MPKTLIAKLRKARQSRVECDQYAFIVRRPTNLEMLGLGGRANQETLLRQFVVGWENVTELDIHAGGNDQQLPFDTDLFIEWISDRPKYWTPITNAIVTAYKAHEARLIEELKN